MNEIEDFSEDSWNELELEVSRKFKVTADFDFMLFIIGLHERGLGFKHYSRDEKNDLLNLGKCTLFELLGYLQKSGTDQEDWPKFEVIKSLNTLTPSFEKHVLKRAMFSYFKRVMH